MSACEQNWNVANKVKQNKRWNIKKKKQYQNTFEMMEYYTVDKWKCENTADRYLNL